MSRKNTKKLVVFFTQDVSLKTWKESGLFEREIKPYLFLARERGWEIGFVTHGDVSDFDYAGQLSPIQVYPLWHRFGVPKFLALRLLLGPLCLLFLRNQIADATVYKTNQFWGGWLAVLAKLFFGGKVMARCGYEYLSFSIDQGHPKWRLAIAWAVDWVCYRFADVIVLASRDDEVFAKNRFPFLKKKNIEIQPNWIDTETFKACAVAGDSKDVVFIGRLSAQKNLENLIRAVAEVGCALDIYGSGEQESALKLVARALNARVEFKGRVANDMIPELLAQYKVFALPSHYEGNPKALLEAMACEKAILTCDVKGINSIVAHNDNGYLCLPNDLSSLAAGITTLLQDKELRARLGKKAREFVIQNNSYASFIEAEQKRLQVLV
jgi:glycosyltransferase involved in cell wall biosynthesis